MNLGGNITPESVETYAVYDGDTGAIYHVHQVVTLKGGQKMSQCDVEARACSIAQKRASFAQNLKVLYVPNDILRPDIIHAVDLSTLSLVVKGRHTVSFRKLLHRIFGFMRVNR